MKNNRKGFTLIELVIVVVIIGILSLMILPSFANVTEEARKKTFVSNCETVVTAYTMFQAAENGETPATGTDLDPYLNGGWAELTDKPADAEYDITDGVFTASYGDLTYTYPISGS